MPSAHVLPACTISSKFELPPTALSTNGLPKSATSLLKGVTPLQVAALTLKWMVLPAAAEVAPYMPVDSQTLQLEGMELQLKVWWPGVSCWSLLPWPGSSVV